eukprot:Tbor_TRINITY_DN2088_c0_g1::TRINITY_DN2088_c0_g1_i1::g.12055::m.12055/K04078/groES, HSPE1; chaperonin GroES
MFRISPIALKTLKPLGERVLIRRTAAVKETTAGILIPDKLAGKLNEGTVVSVAAAGKEWVPSVKVGDTVLLPEYGGSMVKLDGEELFLYNEDALLGVLSQ